MAFVNVPTQMRQFAGGASRIEADGATLRQVFRALGRQFPDLRDRVMQDDGIATGVSVAINDNVVSTGLSEPVPGDAEITIVPQISGGTHRFRAAEINAGQRYDRPPSPNRVPSQPEGPIPLR
jgi:molybdopterin converting factor small subunit